MAIKATITGTIILLLFALPGTGLRGDAPFLLSMSYDNLDAFVQNKLESRTCHETDV
jgi:hypothetical protein